MMLSGKEETQKRMLNNKQLSKNPKLASMTSIARRSPQNRGSIAVTSPPLARKNSIEGGQKVVVSSPRLALSPKNNMREFPKKEINTGLTQKRSSGTLSLNNGDQYEGALLG